METGTTERLEHPRERDRAIEMISKIVGFNYSKAKDVVDKYHVRSIDDLKNVELTEEQKIGKNCYTVSVTIEGVKYLKEFEQKIPRGEIEKFEQIIKATAKEVNKDISVEMCGEYRR